MASLLLTEASGLVADDSADYSREALVGAQGNALHEPPLRLGRFQLGMSLFRANPSIIDAESRL